METLDTFIGYLLSILWLGMLIALASIPVGLLIHGMVLLLGGMNTAAVLLFIGSLAVLLWAIE